MSDTRTVTYLVRFRRGAKGAATLDGWKTRGRAWQKAKTLPLRVRRELQTLAGLDRTKSGLVDAAPFDDLFQDRTGLCGGVDQRSGKAVVVLHLTFEISAVASRKRRRKARERRGGVLSVNAARLRLVVADEASPIAQEFWDKAERVLAAHNEQTEESLRGSVGWCKVK